MRIHWLFVPLAIGLALPIFLLRADESSPPPSHEQVRRWVAAYKAAHSSHGGKDWDINQRSADEVAREPDTRRLLSLCGARQRPVIPQIAWEYGGSDHRWRNPEKAALVYCVYTPVAEPSEHWRFDRTANKVVADVYVLFPRRNPCAGRPAEEQAARCIGGFANLEILADIASLHDGQQVGLSLGSAATELRWIQPGGKRSRLALIE